MLAKHLADHSPDDLFVRLTAFTGLRAGEMLGLQARDVNLHRRTLDVRRTYQYTRAGWVEATPKSDNSTRTVPLNHARGPIRRNTLASTRTGITRLHRYGRNAFTRVAASGSAGWTGTGA